MITASIEQSQVDAITKLLGNGAKDIRKQLYIATNKAANKTKSMIAKEVGRELPAPQKVIKKTIFVRKAKAGSQRKAFVTQKDFQGLPLRFFKPKQVLGGTTYSPSKTRGRQTILGAFQGPKVGAQNAKWKGNAYKRESKSRRPITLQRGPSAWQAFVDLGVEPKAISFASAELKKQVTERIRFLGLKKSGAI